MNWLPKLFSRHERYEEIAKVIQEHLDEKTAELMERGMSREDAVKTARREFGNVGLIEERSREVWQWPTIESIWADTKLACRQLRRTPGFTFTALLIMSFGIGASTAVFSIIDSILLRPFAFRDSSQIVIWHEVVQEATKQYPFVPDNYRHFLYLKSHSKTIEDAALLQNASFAVTAGGDHPRILNGLNVSPQFFGVLGVSPLLGRTFLPEEGEVGRSDVAVISWATWNDVFHADPNAVGRSVKIQGRSTLLVGVLPKDFEFPAVHEMPGATTSTRAPSYEIFHPFVPQGDDLTSDDADFAFLVIARLRQGITLKQATSELGSMLSAYATTNHLPIHLGIFVQSLLEAVTENVRKAFWLVFAAVLGLLLIACVNLASLQLARAIVRDRDQALRAALGAGRIRLLQTALMESVVLCLVGGIIGVVLALGGLRLFIAVSTANIPRINDIHVNWSVLLFAVCLSGSTALLSGILPALRSLNSDPQHALHSSSSRTVRGGQTLFMRRILVSLEIACTVVLLILTSVVVRSFSKVLNQDRGFEASKVVLCEVDLLGTRYEGNYGDNARSAFIERVLDKIRANPGVEFAAVTSAMPMTGEAAVHSIYRPDHPLPEDKVPTANLRNVSPEYFAAMQTHLIAGHEFTAEERTNPRSAIVSESAARAAWPNMNALGRQLKFDGGIYTVTGIAADSHIADLKENVPIVYLPFWHEPPGAAFLLMRTSRSLSEFAPLLRRQVWDIDPEAAIPMIDTLDKQVAQSVAPERLQSIILSSFGIAALVLSVVGVYGVLTYSVSLRTAEFGIRVALGSSKLALIRLVLIEASIPVGSGILIGFALSIATVHVIRNLLYHTSASDPASVGLSVGLLMAASFTAALVPAYRASRVDPTKALRQD